MFYYVKPRSVLLKSRLNLDKVLLNLGSKKFGVSVYGIDKNENNILTPFLKSKYMLFKVQGTMSIWSHSRYKRIKNTQAYKLIQMNNVKMVLRGK